MGGEFGTHLDSHRAGPARGPVRFRHQPPGAGIGRGQCANAGDRGRDPGRGASLSEAPVHDHRGRRRGRRRHRRRVSGRDPGDRLRDRRDPVGRCGLYRDEHLGALERPHRRRRAERVAAGPDARLSRGRDHGPAGGGPRPSRDRRLLLVSDRPGRLCRQRPRRDRRAGRPRLRCLAHLHLRTPRRRDFHQGRRCGRGPRRQGRGGNPGGRSPQPRRDRGQCR